MLLAIVGKKRSGKDTVADYIVNEYNSAKHQLAGPIKDILAAAYSYADLCPGHRKLTASDWHGEGLDRETPLILNNKEAELIFENALKYLARDYRLNPHYSKIDPLIESIVLNNTEIWTMRRFMQTLGTDIVVDHIDRMFWMKLFAEAYFDKIDQVDYFVVPDVRQVHEIDTLRSMGATVVHVVRADSDQSHDQHITEAGLPILPGDVVIENNGTLDELYENIRKTLCLKK